MASLKATGNVHGTASSFSPVGVASDPDGTKPLYSPKDIESSRTYRFLKRVNAKFGLSLETYFDLWKWSTDHIDDFWGEVWDETGTIGHKGSHVVDTTALPPANPPWFAEARLNWAENMLRCRSQHKTALIEASTCRTVRPWACGTIIVCFLLPAEPDPSNPNPALRRVSYAELYALVADLSSALLALGLKPGDRVASYSSNSIVSLAFPCYVLVFPNSRPRHYSAPGAAWRWLTRHRDCLSRICVQRPSD